MIRDPLLPVRLVHGVWISADPAVASPIKDDPFTPTPPRTDADPFPPTWRPFPCFPDPVVFTDVVLPPRPATDYARAFAEYNPPTSCEVTIPITVNADDWRKFAEAHQDPITIEHNHATGETSVSFDAEATCPGGEPIPVRAVVTWTPPRRIFAAVALDGSGVWAIGDTEADARNRACDHRGFHRGLGCDMPPPETDAAWLDLLALVTLSGTTEGLRALIKSMETGDPVAPWCPADLWDSGEVIP